MLLVGIMISLIIPVYAVNKRLVDITDRCLTSVLHTTPQDIELIVVDDGSQPPYHAHIGRLITLDDNGGYVQAVNTGMEAATGDIIILGNNDLTFHENWLPELLFPLNVGFDIATCWTSDQHNIKLEDKIESHAKFGAIFAMTRDVYETVGEFDDQFRGYFSDTDYRRRAIEYGFRIGKNLSLVIEHEAKATYSVTDPRDDEFLRAQRLYEAKYGYAE